MMVMILSLGLIHGFGLSTRLQELPLSEDELLLNIISFNVGIEIGQISALVLMLLVIATFRKSHFFQTFSTITNYFLIIAGGLLFLMQLHGYEHTANAAEFTNSSTPQQKAVDTKKNVEIKNSGKSQLSEWKDTINLTIPARGDKEYKVFVKQGAAFDYSWRTDGEELFFDFHGEPSGDTTGAFESFEKNTTTQSSGTLVTSFSGTHGWYWKNYTSNPVVITLRLNGEYQRKDIAMDVEENSPVNKKSKPKHDSID
jgi:hypothetical protein